MNKLVVCPYDEAHKVKESRLALHITKCRSNHLDEEKFICPFHASHVLPRQERDYHLLHCPDRAPLDRKMLANSLDKNNPFKGNTAVPSYTSSVPTVSDEVWDDDYFEPTSRVELNEPLTFGIVEPPALSKPAERRRLYQELHRMPTEMERISSQTSAPTQKTTGIQQNRQPKAPSQVENKKTNLEFQSLGLGRGKPMGVSRIAANIFPAEPAANSSNSVNYSAALTSGMSNLGLGRGFPTNTVNDNQFDDQFPALGCGRGVYKPAKSGARYPGSRS